MKQITASTHDDYASTDPDVQAKYQRLAAEYLAEMDIAVEWSPLSSHGNWRDTGDEDITTDEGFFVQGILERAWDEAHA